MTDEVMDMAVELLRCAADLSQGWDACCLFDVFDFELRHEDEDLRSAVWRDITAATAMVRASMSTDDYLALTSWAAWLEAAQLLEGGEVLP